MRIICFVKLVPDVENFKYDYDRNVLVRENVHQIINPEDGSALAAALKLKQERPDVHIETVTMGPQGIIPHLEDLVRRGVDRATVISDRIFAGSDTYVTSAVLSRYLADRQYDWIFSGSRSLDGGTAHVPPQVAERLDIGQMSNIMKIDEDSLFRDGAIVDVDSEDAVLRFELDRPAILSFQYSTKIKLPYIKYEDIDRDVSGKIQIITNEQLGFSEGAVGLGGSLTRVLQVEVEKIGRKDTAYLRCDEEGIEFVYRFLKQKGFIAS